MQMCRRIVLCRCSACKFYFWP